MSDLFSSIENMFTNSTVQVRTLDDLLVRNEQVMNSVVNDLVTGFLTAKNANERGLINLLNSDYCHNASVFLAKTMNESLDEYPVALDKFDSTIVVNKEISPPCKDQETCNRAISQTFYNAGPERKVTKWELCYSLASHYIRILNLIGAICVAINPKMNMCIERLNRLYTIIITNNGDQAFHVNVCTQDESKPIHLEHGFKELINLYMIDQLDKIKTVEDLNAYEEDYKNLQKALKDYMEPKTIADMKSKSEAIGDLLSTNPSHDLQTELDSINHHLESMDDNDKYEASRQLDSINKKLDSILSKLKPVNEQSGGGEPIDDFLAFIESYIKKNKADVKTKFTNFGTLTREGVSDLCKVIGRKEVEVTLDDINSSVYLQAFYENYNNMKDAYLDATDELINILTTEILYPISKTPPHYQIKKMSKKELRTLQVKVRKLLLDMYTINHNYYNTGLKQLTRYFQNKLSKRSSLPSNKTISSINLSVNTD